MSGPELAAALGNARKAAQAATKDGTAAAREDGWWTKWNGPPVDMSVEEKTNIAANVAEEIIKDAGELKAALRSSGAITSMYDDSLRTFGLLLTATLGVDALIFLTSGGKAAFTGFGVEWMLKEADPETKRDWKDTLRALTGAGVTLGTFKLRVGYDANDPKTAPEPAVATDAAPPAVAAGA